MTPRTTFFTAFLDSEFTMLRETGLKCAPMLFTPNHAMQDPSCTNETPHQSARGSAILYYGIFGVRHIQQEMRSGRCHVSDTFLDLTAAAHRLMLGHVIWIMRAIISLEKPNQTERTWLRRSLV